MASWLKALGLKEYVEGKIKTHEERVEDGIKKIQNEIDAKVDAKLGLEEAPDRQPTPKAEVAELLAWSGMAAYSKAEQILNEKLGKFPRPDEDLADLLLGIDDNTDNGEKAGGGYLEVDSTDNPESATVTKPVSTTPGRDDGKDDPDLDRAGCCFGTNKLVPPPLKLSWKPADVREHRDPRMTLHVPKADAMPTDVEEGLKDKINESAKNANDVMRLLAPDSRPTGKPIGDPTTVSITEGGKATEKEVPAQGEDAVLSVVNPADYESFSEGLRKYAQARDIARDIGGKYLVDDEEERIMKGGMSVAAGRLLKPVDEKKPPPKKPAWLQRAIETGTATAEEVENYIAEMELFFEDPEAYFRQKLWEKAAKAKTLCFDAIVNNASKIKLRVGKNLKKSVLRGPISSSVLQFLIVGALVFAALLIQAIVSWVTYDEETDLAGEGPGWIIDMGPIFGPGAPFYMGGGGGGGGDGGTFLCPGRPAGEYCDGEGDCGGAFCDCEGGQDLCYGSEEDRDDAEMYAFFVVCGIVVVLFVAVYVLTYGRSGNYKGGIAVQDVRLKYKGLKVFNQFWHELLGFIFVLVVLAALVIGLIIFAQKSGPALVGFLAGFVILTVNIAIGAIAAYAPTLLEKLMMKLAKYGGKKLLAFLKSKSITVARVVTAVLIAFAYCITGRFCFKNKEKSEEISLIPMREMKLAIYRDIEGARESGVNPMTAWGRIPSEYYDAYRNERGTLDPYKYLVPPKKHKQGREDSECPSCCDIVFKCLSCAWCPLPEFNPILAILEWIELIIADFLRLIILPLSLLPCCKGLDVKFFEDCADCFLDGWDCNELHEDCTAPDALDFGSVLPSPKINNIGKVCQVTLLARDGSTIGEVITGTVLWQGYDNFLPVPLVAVQVDDKWYEKHRYEVEDPTAKDKNGNPVMHKMVHEALDPVEVHGKYICCPCLWKVSKGGFDGKYLGREIITDNSLALGISTEGLKGADLVDAKAKLAKALVWGSLDDVNDTRTLMVPANMVSIKQPPVVEQPKAPPPPNLLSVPEPSASNDQGPHQLLVTWPAAVIENGAIQRYQLRHGPEGENLTTVDVGRSTSYMLSDLEPSTDYIIYLDTFIKNVNAPATSSVRKHTPQKALPFQPGKFRKMEEHDTNETFKISTDPVVIVPEFREQNVGFRRKQSWKKAATVDGQVVAGAYAPLCVHADGTIVDKFESDEHGETVAAHFVRGEAFVPTVEPERLDLDPFPSNRPGDTTLLNVEALSKSVFQVAEQAAEQAAEQKAIADAKEAYYKAKGRLRKAESTPGFAASDGHRVQNKNLLKHSKAVLTAELELRKLGGANLLAEAEASVEARMAEQVKTEQKISVAQQAYFTAIDAVQRAAIDTDGTKTQTRMKKRQKKAEANLRAAERELYELGGGELLAASEAMLDDDLSRNMAWG